MTVLVLYCARSSQLWIDYPTAVLFRRFNESPSSGYSNQQLVLADDGYNSLLWRGSVESFFIGFGPPVSRDGIVNLELHPIDWKSRKMRRVVRASLAAGDWALAASIDFAYCVRAVYIELFYGELDYRNFNSTKDAPSVVPFSYKNPQVLYSPMDRIRISAQSPLMRPPDTLQIYPPHIVLPLSGPIGHPLIFFPHIG